MDRLYLDVLRRYRKVTRTIVVAGIDDQWHGGFRQRLGVFYCQLFYRHLIDVMWVAGGPQRIFAERFGYRGKRVIPYLLSADVDRMIEQPIQAGKRFLFVGRFDPVKGLNTLVDAYRLLPDSVRSSWTLELVGDGPLRESLSGEATLPGIRIHPYLQPDDLLSFLADGGVACFPSLHEQWGVAIHELAALGCPLVLSDVCGAATEFLIDGYNGYRCCPGDPKSLSECMHRVAALSDAHRQLFSQRSRQLASRITPKLSAASILSLLE